MKALHINIVALFVLAAVALGGTVYFYTQIEDERRARSQAEKSKSDLERVIQEKERLVSEKSQNLASLETQANELKAEIRSKNQELAKNRTSIAQLESKVKDLNEKINIAEKEKRDLKSELEYYQKSSESPVLSALSDEAAAKSNPDSGGKVILVNREYHFIVVGIGKLDGVNLKDQLEIVRGNQVIGKVAVSKLYDALSSCEILEESPNPIQEGDLVRPVTKA